MKITVESNAKINLLLDIVGNMEDGFREVNMFMQSVSLADRVTVEKTGEKINVSCDESAIPSGEGNIAHKAAKEFFERTGIEPVGVNIHIEKKIPHAAGLAGGSADAAAVIFALKEMFAPSMSERALIEIGTSVGSDVPFCLLGGTMQARGRGTVLSWLPQLDLPFIVLCKPDCSVSTAAAYAAFDSAENVRHPDTNGMFWSIMNGDYDGIFRRVANCFEQFIDVPQRVDIKAVMRRNGAKCACMSGSGPSVFGIFESESNAKKCAEELNNQFNETFLVGSEPVGVKIINKEQ